ncbi:MAG: hypothetical protein ACRD22_06435 [Terriglobia bacterium]
MAYRISCGDRGIACPVCMAPMEGYFELGEVPLTVPIEVTSFGVGFDFPWIYDGPPPTNQKWFVVGEGRCERCNCAINVKCHFSGLTLVRYEPLRPDELISQVVVSDTTVDSAKGSKLYIDTFHVAVLPPYPTRDALFLGIAAFDGRSLRQRFNAVNGPYDVSVVKTNGQLYVGKGVVGGANETSLGIILFDASFPDIPIGSVVTEVAGENIAECG